MKKFSQHFTESKKNIIAGLEYMSDKMNPESKVYYGIVEMDFGGEIIDIDLFQSPKPLPKNAVYVTDSAFMVPGQKPDYETYFPMILITDEEVMSAVIRDDWENELIKSFLDRLYSALKVNGTTDPILP
jgi:hypothetical protein